MIKIKYILKSVTPLQFARKDELESDIREKILATAPNENNAVKSIQNVNIIVPENVEKREIIRRKYHNASLEIGVKNSREIVCYLPAGTDLSVVIEIGDDVVEDIANALDSFIKALGEGKVRIGKNITLGYGRCKCIRADFDSEVDEEVPGLSIFKDHLKRTISSGVSEANILTAGSGCDRIEADVISEDGILIRNCSGKIKSSNNNGIKTDLPYVTDNTNCPVIPASTWKGIFRTAVSEWVKYNKDDLSLIDRMFGNREKRIKGCLVFYDSAIHGFNLKNSSRVHINKLSATVIENSVRENLYITGKATIRIECLEDIKPYIEYLYAVLRDLHSGRINVGADKGIGKGFIKIINVRQVLAGEMKTVL